MKKRGQIQIAYGDLKKVQQVLSEAGQDYSYSFISKVHSGIKDSKFIKGVIRKVVAERERRERELLKKLSKQTNG